MQCTCELVTVFQTLMSQKLLLFQTVWGLCLAYHSHLTLYYICCKTKMFHSTSFLKLKKSSTSMLLMINGFNLSFPFILTVTGTSCFNQSPSNNEEIGSEHSFSYVNSNYNCYTACHLLSIFGTTFTFVAFCSFYIGHDLEYWPHFTQNSCIPIYGTKEPFSFLFSEFSINYQ